MTQLAIPDRWSPQALYHKAQRYIQRATEQKDNDWEHLLWTSLSLELLARSALATISPTLLADPTDRNGGWVQIYTSLGYSPPKTKYTAKSRAISEVLTILEQVLDSFTAENLNFCLVHTGMRNSEVHTGELVFDGKATSEWQPKFYDAVQCLLGSMGRTLEEYVGEDEAQAGYKQIRAAADDGAASARQEVVAHQRVWESKKKEERETLHNQATVWASRRMGHRVDCPSCGSIALLQGDPTSSPVRVLDGGEVSEKQEHLPSSFECVACGLRITGLSRLLVLGLGDRFTKTEFYDLAELYSPEDHYYGYEEDNNE